MKERELIALLERDPEEGMEAVMATYTGLLWKVASGLLRSREDIQDCVSETFSEFYLHRGNYHPEQGALGGYLAAIARRRAAGIYRKSSRELLGSGPDPDSLIEDSDWQEKLEQSMIVDQAVAGLDEASQKIIRMKYYEGLSTREIADSLNVPYETVKKRHTRSIQKLRKLLLTLLVIAILLFLAACGVVYVLRHLGVLPGYGVTADPDAFCCLMEERTPTVETEEYTAWIESARLYDGVLEAEFHIELPEQPYEWRSHSWYPEDKIPVYPLDFMGILCRGDGTPLPGEADISGSGINQTFHGYGCLTLPVEQDVPDTLRQEGRMTMELRITNISFDEKQFPDAVIPFTLVAVQQRPLENYPGFYDETAGGFLLDSRMEDGVLTMDVYSIYNGTTRVWSGLSLDPMYPISLFEDSAPPVIRGEDGSLYPGEVAPEESSSGYRERKFTTFYFPDAPPGRYTLTIPYAYVLTHLDKPGQLTWNLEKGTFSGNTLEYPGVRMQTVSVEETGPDSPDPAMIRGWKVVVGVELENEAMRPVRAFYYPIAPEKLPYRVSKFFGIVKYFFFGTSSIIYQGKFSAGEGKPGDEDGTLIYTVNVDGRAYEVYDMTKVELRPERDRGGPLVILYDQPIELEFEVTP